MNKFAHETQGNPVSTVKGVMNVYAEKNPSAGIAPVVCREAAVHEESYISYTSDSYQKILDYHVAEILLSTVVFGVILLLRLHR